MKIRSIDWIASAIAIVLMAPADAAHAQDAPDETARSVPASGPSDGTDESGTAEPVAAPQESGSSAPLRITLEVLLGETFGTAGVLFGGLVGYGACGSDTTNCLVPVVIGAFSAGTLAMSLGVWIVGSKTRDGDFGATWGGAIVGGLLGLVGSALVHGSRACDGTGGCSGETHPEAALAIALTVPIAVTVLTFELTSTEQKPDGATFSLYPSPGGLLLRSQF